MPQRYRPDAVSLHVADIRKLLPGRKIARLCCPSCGAPCQLVFLHPDSPDEWKCKVCQQFTVMRNGRYALNELARVRQALAKIAREHPRQVAPEAATPPGPPKRTRTTGSG